MTNTAGFTTVTPLSLQRSCFTDEQDRLNEYAKALRVPIQTGQVIKGDQGPVGPRGPQGSRGPRGDTGPAGADAVAAFNIADYIIAVGETTVTVTGDATSSVVSLVYDNPAAAPGVNISIMHIRYNGTDTIVTLSAAAPNDKYFVRVLSL
jgi:hypothetical protein